MGDVDKPEITDETVLVRVHATSINAHDWHMLRGKPYIARLDEGVRSPKTAVLGLDVAGVAEDVGRHVTHIKPGDRVFGSRSGAFAEYITGRTMVPMPAGVTFEQAAAVPTAGQTALQGLRDHGRLEAGQAVLVNGAGGGVGGFAVQIAKAMGAEVTAVTKTQSLEMVRSIGADEVIDHTSEDFTRLGGRYDLILDAGGNRSIAQLRRALRAGGTLVLVAPGPGQWVGPLIRIAGAALNTRFSDHAVRFFIATPNKEDLTYLGELMEAGELTPVIDRRYSFDEIPDAVRYVEGGQVQGKVVVTV